MPLYKIVSYFRGNKADPIYSKCLVCNKIEDHQGGCYSNNIFSHIKSSHPDRCLKCKHCGMLFVTDKQRFKHILKPNVCASHLYEKSRRKNKFLYDPIISKPSDTKIPTRELRKMSNRGGLCGSIAIALLMIRKMKPAA